MTAAVRNDDRGEYLSLVMNVTNKDPAVAAALDDLHWYFSCGDAALGFHGNDPASEYVESCDNDVEARIIGLIDRDRRIEVASGSSGAITRSRRVARGLSRLSSYDQHLIHRCHGVSSTRWQQLVGALGKCVPSTIKKAQQRFDRCRHGHANVIDIVLNASEAVKNHLHWERAVEDAKLRLDVALGRFAEASR